MHDFFSPCTPPYLPCRATALWPREASSTSSNIGVRQQQGCPAHDPEEGAEATAVGHFQSEQGQKCAQEGAPASVDAWRHRCAHCHARQEPCPYISCAEQRLRVSQVLCKGGRAAGEAPIRVDPGGRVSLAQEAWRGRACRRGGKVSPPSHTLLGFAAFTHPLRCLYKPPKLQGLEGCRHIRSSVMHVSWPE